MKPRVPRLKLSKLPGADITPLLIPGETKICNPSIAKSDRGFRCVVRTVTYELNSRGRLIAPPEEGFKSTNWLLDLDADLQVVEARLVDQSAARLDPAAANDLEDCRLVRWKDAWWLSATWVFEFWPPKAQMALCRLDEARVAEVQLLRSPVDAPVEKNWMPRVDGELLEWIYRIDPPAIVTYHGKDLLYRQLNRLGRLEGWSGSSQVVPYRGNWLCVVHHKKMSGKGIAYAHRFVELTDDFAVRRVSRRFSFEGEDIEFCGGLCLTDSHAILSYGLWDRQAHLLRLDLASVESMLRPYRMPQPLAIALADLRRKAQPWIRHRWVRQPGKQIRAITARWKENRDKK